MEKAEPTAIAYIRSIGLDPNVPLQPSDIKEVEGMYGAGQRRIRRQWLLIRAAEYIFRLPNAPVQEILLLLGRSMPRIKVMVDHMVGYWDEEYRPKTWVDSLTSTQQLDWASLKKDYAREIEQSNRAVETAKAAYQRVIAEEQTRQLAARLKLQDFLVEVGAKDAPLLQARGAEEMQAELTAEFEGLGLAVPSFRADVASISRADEKP
jgi:hypothetical protein